MRSMQWQLGMLGTVSAFAYRHREPEKNLSQSRSVRHQNNCLFSHCRPDGVSLLIFTAQFKSQFRYLYISCHAYKVGDVCVTVYGHFSVVLYVTPSNGQLLALRCLCRNVIIGKQETACVRLPVSPWWRPEMYRECWRANLKGRGHLEDLGVDGTVLKWILNKQGARDWCRFRQLWIGKSGLLL